MVRLPCLQGRGVAAGLWGAQRPQVGVPGTARIQLREDRDGRIEAVVNRTALTPTEAESPTSHLRRQLWAAMIR